MCDVRDPDAVQELADRTYRDVGPVRLLVNNAGVEQFGYLWDTPVANWQPRRRHQRQRRLPRHARVPAQDDRGRRPGVGVEPVVDRRRRRRFRCRRPTS